MTEHVLPKLPYDYNALEPHIDAKTMEIHHSKHHQAYVNNLNNTLKDHPDLQKKTLEELIKNLNSVPEAIRNAVRNNGGGHLNHSFFWQVMGPGKCGEPSGELLEKIKSTFESFEKFKEKLNAAGVGRFGSGWAWLTVDKNGNLLIESTPNQDNPITEGRTPILGVDVWEHSYYLKWNSNRLGYLQTWWNVVNWEEIEKNLKMTKL